MDHFICVHGHFYQPPRENPWLDVIEVQDSAAPFHDWNERVTAESYAPNAASRILDDRGFIQRVVNNYARISFNFGPTLLVWLQEHAQDVYSALLTADRLSAERFSGHGSAIAQAYSHMILPLANDRDKRTQVIWGIRDFEHRFGRRPEGMWLPETAVDTPTLEALAEQGIAFTILAPHQAKRVRLPGAQDWQDVDESSLDTSRAYCARLPSGRSISLFFYDGGLSHAVAFEHLLASGAQFGRRLIDAVAGRQGPALGHIATDGETYGHHQRFGDMALAYALEVIDADPNVALTNYGEFLAAHPSEALVEIAEPTSWSCAHGVERWRSDCGCNTGAHPGWRQAWRAPLRAALDGLRESLSGCFEKESTGLLTDPWATRDDYIALVLDRAPQRALEFVAEHSGAQPLPDQLTKALRLLEMQRQAMLMFTSCAWFFDDVAGIETVQVLRHAGRAIQLAQELGHDFEPAFLDALSLARSNDASQGDAAAIYRRQVLPAKLDLERLARHYAVCAVFRAYDERAPIGAYTVERLNESLNEAGRSVFALGRVRVTSSVTLESEVFAYAVLHLGDQNLTGGLGPSGDAGAYDRLAAEAEQIFNRGDFPSLTHLIEGSFAGEPLSLRSLFLDDLRRITRLILDPVLEEAEDSYRTIYEEHLSLIRFVTSLDVPLPRRLSLAGEVALNLDLERALQAPELDGARVASLLEAAKLADISLDDSRLSLAMQQTLRRLADAFAAAPGDDTALEALETAVRLLPDLGFEVDIWRVQNQVYAALNDGSLPQSVSAERTLRLRALAEALRVRVAL